MEIVDNQPIGKIDLRPASPLNEDEIKRAFLPFLRDFYKNRYPVEHGTEQATFDNRSEEGYIADGKLTFLISENEDTGERLHFTATFEATSRDKIEEVKFERNDPYLIWDSTAFAGMFTAGFFGLSVWFRPDFLKLFGAWGTVGMIFVAWLLFFSLWFFIMRGWRKYRYIYAVEQFNQYEADEQWVALAEDVFPSPGDPFFQELKNQCVYHGYGLALVHFDKSVRAVATPSRLGLFGKGRRAVEWVTETELYQRVANLQLRSRTPDAVVQLFQNLWRPIQYNFVDPIYNGILGFFNTRAGARMTEYARFMRVQGTQKMMIALSLVATGYFFNKSLNFKVIEFADEETYGAELHEKLRGENPEDTRGYVLDNPEQYGAIPKQYPDLVKPGGSGYSYDKDGVQTIDLSGGGDPDEIGGQFSRKKKAAPRPQGYSAAAQKSTRTARPAAKSTAKTDPCAPAHSAGWLIQDGYFSDKTFAEERAAELRHHGLQARIVPKSCFDDRDRGYFVFIGQIFPGETAARAELDDVRNALSRYGLTRGVAFLRRL